MNQWIQLYELRPSEMGESMADTEPSILEMVRRVRGEFLEMPGLRLTRAQAQRLWRLDERACAEVLNVLVDARFLAKTADGAFRRPDAG